MTARAFSIIALLFSLATSFSAERPNIVVLLADDAGFGDFSINGNSSVRTPNIDSLGREGARFERFYVCSVCAPTRAEFFTGRYHPRTGVRGVSTGLERMNTDEKTIGDVFKSAGYATGAFGKWHNGSQWPYHPNARGFDEYVGFTSGHWGEYFDPPLERNGRPERAKGYIADIFTAEALRFIERNRSKPFLCYIPYNTPHSPWAVPDEYWRRFKDKDIAMRGALGDREALESTRCALAMIENLDWNVGRILQKLDELHLATNTIVVFFSDNGPNTQRWNAGMKGIKGSVDEGGLRSPLYIRWPAKIQPGATIREIAGAIDLLPTLASLTQTQLTPSPGKPLDGKDLSPLLFNAAADWPDRRIFSHQNGRASVRTRRHRLDDKGALFEISADPNQNRNIAAEQPALAAELSEAVAKWREEVLPKGPDRRPYPVGFVQFPITTLPARDGVPHGEIKRSASAPNCSYFVNWRGTNDAMTWDIDVHTAGDYDVVIHQTTPAAALGATIELTFESAVLEKKLDAAWDPPLYTNQDTIPRPRAESQMKEFRPLSLGAIHLSKSRAPLTLRASAVPTPTASLPDIRQITLTLRK